MKKQIVIAAGLAVLSTSAFATKARMDALGQQSAGGSHYIQDTRNIFRNAAHVNTFKNYVVTEWGTANNNADSTATPHAEGGFFREMGAFAYGLYMGNESDANNTMRQGGNGFANSAAYGAANFINADNALDLFFGGDMGVQWGANLHYTSNSNEPAAPALKQEQSGLGLGLGMIMGDLDASVNLGLSDESKEGSAVGATWNNTGVEVNVGYALGDMKVFAEFDKDTVKWKANTATAEIKTENTAMLFGVAKTHEVSSTARITAALAYSSNKGKDTDLAGATTELTTSNLPLSVTFEAEANSWLTLRGSVSQAVILNSVESKSTASTTKNTDPNTTSVNAGATLSFGKLKVDGSIGNGTTGNTQGGKLNLDTVMTRVGVHYWF